MTEYQKMDTYLEKNLEKSLEELGKLVAQPSISAQGIGLKECASLVADMLRARGLVLGPEFRAADQPVPVLALGIAFLCLRNTSQTGAMIAKRPGYIAWVTSGAAALAIALNLLLIPKWAGMGAAAATAGAFGAEFFVMRRLSELREVRIPGLSTIEEFLHRRLAPAMATCRRASRRIGNLAARLTRAGALLRTRVDITREQQNQKLLEAMNRRGRLQLRRSRPWKACRSW